MNGTDKNVLIGTKSSQIDDSELNNYTYKFGFRNVMISFLVKYSIIKH